MMEELHSFYLKLAFDWFHDHDVNAFQSCNNVSMFRVLGSGGTVLPKVESVFTHKLKPGLSSYELAPSNASHSIKGLLELALDQVPRAHWRKTPVFLKAYVFILFRIALSKIAFNVARNLNQLGYWWCWHDEEDHSKIGQGIRCKYLYTYHDIVMVMTV